MFNVTFGLLVASLTCVLKFISIAGVKGLCKFMQAPEAWRISALVQ